MLNLIKLRIIENKEKEVKKKYFKNLSLISSIMLRKLRLMQKKWFSYKKRVFASVSNETSPILVTVSG